MSFQSNTDKDQLAAQIDAILPQTQCTKCGYSGCKPYAIAIVNQQADINQCPPGGDAGVHALAALTHIAYKPLNAQNGIEKPKALAYIDEAVCIGCTLCIQACPVDAILGAAKQMHTVIASECTGCELCLAPCPVDCIRMETAAAHLNTREAIKKTADLARKRYDFRLRRIARAKAESAQRYQHHAKTVSEKNHDNQSASLQADAASNHDLTLKNRQKSAVAAAIERAKSLKMSATAKNTHSAKD